MSRSGPVWFARRLPHLKQTGSFSLAGEHDIDLIELSYPESASVLTICRRLDLSRTLLSSLDGLPFLPRLLSFTADHSQLSSFKNFRALRRATSISLKNTPVSRTPTYRLSLLLAVGSQSLASIDGTQISPRLKSRAETFHAICSDLVNAGWIATSHPPNVTDIQQLCEQYEIPTISEEQPQGEEEEEEGQPSSEQLPFDDLLAQLQGEHEQLFSKWLQCFEKAAEDTDS
jgi:hypothetical protein